MIVACLLSALSSLTNECNWKPDFCLIERNRRNFIRPWFQSAQLHDTSSSSSSTPTGSAPLTCDMMPSSPHTVHSLIHCSCSHTMIEWVFQNAHHTGLRLVLPYFAFSVQRRLVCRHRVGWGAKSTMLIRRKLVLVHGLCFCACALGLKCLYTCTCSVGLTRNCTLTLLV